MKIQSKDDNPPYHSKVSRSAYLYADPFAKYDDELFEKIGFYCETH